MSEKAMNDMRRMICRASDAAHPERLTVKAIAQAIHADEGQGPHWLFVDALLALVADGVLSPYHERENGEIVPTVGDYVRGGVVLTVKGKG